MVANQGWPGVGQADQAAKGCSSPCVKRWVCTRVVASSEQKVAYCRDAAKVKSIGLKTRSDGVGAKRMRENEILRMTLRL